MAPKVKIYEIAKRIGISSSELVKLCQRAGYDHIKHYSNAVPPEEAEEIRKSAIRLYRPKEVVPPKKKVKPKKAEKPEKEKPKKIPSTEHVKPVAPPTPKGRQPRAAVVRKPEEKPPRAQPPRVEQKGAPAAPPTRRRRERKPPSPQERAREQKPRSTRRTVIFKQVRKPPTKKKETKIELTLPVTVRDLSERMGVSASELIKRLMLDHHVRVNINQIIEREVVELIGLAYGVEITFRAAKSAEEMLAELIPQDRPEDLKPRSPVVALLGHVDHGKTSILDRIRSTRVAGTEDGGITQDIGAWQINYKGRVLTFVDTPGHEAFTAMRARGAQVTDLVILVVAADDGVMAQTVEAVSHARAARVPIVVALNKIDKPESNPMRVMQQLVGQDLNPEEWGGEVGCVQVSALTGEGIDELIERTLLEAELLEPKANFERRADGAVLEARMGGGLGVVANVIVRNGTIRKGNIMLCGPAHGRVRSLLDEDGKEVQQAGPSTPVAVSGLDKVPGAGDRFVVVEELEVARNIAEQHHARLEEERRQPRAHVTLENLYESLAAGREQRLRVVLKADAKGSLEPLVNSLQRLGTDEVSVRFLHQAVGSVNTSDVLLADASDAVILAFRVGIQDRARSLARDSAVDIRYYRVIYEAVQTVRDSLEGLLKPELREERLGVAEVRQVFRISRVGSVAGCYVREGQIRRGGRVRLLHDGTVVHEGTIASLRREKDDVREVEGGYECGIRFERYDDVRVGDLIECYTVREVKRTLS